MGTAAILATRRMPFLAYWALCWAGGFAARKAWQVAEDVHALAAEAAEAANDRAWAAEIAGLSYCGADCPGHTTGAPGESCMRAPDAQP